MPGPAASARGAPPRSGRRSDRRAPPARPHAAARPAAAAPSRPAESRSDRTAPGYCQPASGADETWRPLISCYELLLTGRCLEVDHPLLHDEYGVLGGLDAG